MTNTEAITAFEFDVVLPTGITITDCSLSDRKGDDHSISYSLLSNGNSYKVTALSLSNTAFSGNDGTLVNLKLKLPDNIEQGNYAVQIKNIELATESIKIYPSDCFTTLSVINHKIGDVDGNGKVSIFDAVQVVNMIIGRNPTEFVEIAADIDGNGKISIFDAVSIVNIILSQNANEARMKDINISDAVEEIKPQ